MDDVAVLLAAPSKSSREWNARYIEGHCYLYWGRVVLCGSRRTRAGRQESSESGEPGGDMPGHRYAVLMGGPLNGQRINVTG
ncbi:hypothetical protein ACIBCU_37485 [Streptomyces sp. NPDC051064]|uniref:hypothetical protein n=1 Tax=Streptomyces sp. NPDC051064 TaxID=3365641 RepID=UPI00379A2153